MVVVCVVGDSMASKYERENIIRKIKMLFDKKVKGKKAESNGNKGHDGKDGHWLESQMGIGKNCNNAPDLFGFEMKTGTKSKTTFGDWSASYYLFKCNNNKNSKYSRSEFLQMFGKPNPLKKNRYSWSGEPCPKVNKYNKFGQTLVVNKDKSISAIYSYDKDQREDKKNIIPSELRISNVILAKWDHKWMKKKVESKFNLHGWFKCLRDSEGKYVSIKFGPPFNFETWLSLVEEGKIYLDSGMYEGNKRNYSHWRADNKLWDNLIEK